MKFLLLLSLLLTASVTVIAQTSNDSVTSQSPDSTVEITGLHANQSDTVSISFSNDTIPEIRYNKYGDLLNDDPEFNPKYPWWLPSLRILGANLLNWAAARYIYKFDWAV